MAARLSAARDAAGCGAPAWRDLEASFRHPIFDPLRPALTALAAERDWPDAQGLNALGAKLGPAPHNALGMPIRFVAPHAGVPGYERHVYETGCVATRPRNLHDLFNALVWLSFPRLKAALNARHAAEIPREGGRRGPLRDLLTLVDEGGALVACADAGLEELVRAQRWKALFWDQRERAARGMRIVVVGHAVLEKAIAPWPGITCKALFIEVERPLVAAPGAELAARLDERAAVWLASLPHVATPRLLPPLPVFGYAGWHPGSKEASFYEDERYFRAFRSERARTAARGA